MTDSNGHYLAEVPPGSGYTVTPVAGSVPGGLSATTPVPAVVPPLAAGEVYLAADFGYDDRDQNLLGKVGNLVWRDTNQNGVFDSGSEIPLAGVSVDLIRDTNGDGAWDLDGVDNKPGTADDEPIIATVTTGSALDAARGGNYLFTGVPQGKYLVHVSDTNAVLLDFTKSPLGDQGRIRPTKLIRTGWTWRTPGTTTSLADFGYYQNTGDEVGVIGNQVWIESVRNGIFDPLEGDFGQPGVTVLLQKQGAGGVWSDYGTPTTTGASGDYSFLHLPAGEYRVSVSDLYDVLLGYNVTVLGVPQGADNRNQNQVPNGYGVSLPIGGYNVTADFGYWQPGCWVRSGTSCGTTRITTASRTWASRGCRTCGWICI